MIQINEKKYARQQIGQQKWKQAAELGLSVANGWGAWEWVTAMGKTFATCDIIKKMLARNSAHSFIIVVPGPEILKQWKDTINEIVAAEHHNMIAIYTIHKLMEDSKVGIEYNCSLLVLDEMHEYYSDERIKIFHRTVIKSTYCLGLTANYEDINHRHNLIQGVLPVVDRVTLEEAEKEGFVSKFIEYNIGVPLSPAEQNTYNISSEKMTNNLSKLGKNGLESANKILVAAGKKDYGYIFAIASNNGWRKDLNLADPKQKEINDLWHPKMIIGYASNGINALRERKTILYNAVNKIKAAIELITKFDTLKTICFSQTTLFADTLAFRVNDYYANLDPHSKKVCVVYHSALKTIITEDNKKKGKTILKREAIEAIRSGEARVLSTASSLDRGFNVEDIELAVTTSGTQNPTQYNQRKGRSLRVMESRDKMALIVNIYARNTQDERWLKKRQSKSTNIIYYVNSVDEISYSPKNNESINLQEI